MPRGVYIRTDAYREKQRQAILRRENPGVNKSEETKRRIGEAQKGKPKSEAVKKKMRERMKGQPSCFKGKKHTLEVITQMSINRKGKNHYNWKGGVSSENSKIRSSGEYTTWRKTVFLRDNYTCVFCGIKGGALNADHIKPFAAYPELRFELNNGRTLCVKCHKTTATYGGKYTMWQRTA